MKRHSVVVKKMNRSEASIQLMSATTGLAQHNFSGLGLFLSTFIICISVPSHAEIWHVSHEELPGIDANCQQRTIGDAVARIRAGDTIIIHGGIYREQVVVDRSGSLEAPVFIEAADGAYVVLTGADRVIDWDAAESEDRVYSTPWPHRFVGWNKHGTHPDDNYHRLIGRCEQVFISGYPLHQVLERARLGRGTFYVDLGAQRLYVCPAGNENFTGNRIMTEAAVRSRILHVKGHYVKIAGLRFRYAANRAQQGAVELSGDHVTVEDCVFEYTNAGGAAFRGRNTTVRNCTFQHNGQLGFGANRAHGMHMIGCTVRNNNTKGFNRGWEAGGNKIGMTRDAVIEKSTFVENRGNGIWFDIGNENCTVRNCLIAFNENAGIFYEISYGLHACDNVIVGNGFAHTPGAWGANAGISLSSSPFCTVERNLIIGNKEGFNFREQRRTTRRLSGESQPVWNHDQTVRRNVFAHNRDAQVWGWFDVADDRHWPRAASKKERNRRPAGETSNRSAPLPANPSLEDLNLTLENNLYCPGPGQGLFNWGVTWKKHEKYTSLDQVYNELSLAQAGKVGTFDAANASALDLRVPPDSPAITMGCYPQGTVPSVQLGRK